MQADIACANLKNSIAVLIMRVLVLSEQARIGFLQELIKDAKDRIRNGFVFGVVGLLFASFGFFFYATGLIGFSIACLALGTAGLAMVIAAFYVMIRSDRQKGMWMSELRNISLSVPNSSEPEHPADDNDEYFDARGRWKDPFEKDEE